MADTKITALTAITTVDPAADVLPIVDVSDTSMAASGTTKKITSNQILGAGGTATLASATITGDLTVATNTLKTTSGNVGIGTVTPDIFSRFYTRTIGFNSSGSTVMQINGSSYSGIDLGAGGTRTFGIASSATDASLTTITNIPIVFGINGSEAMRLNATGLGVGDTPASNTRLTVAAASRLADTTGQAYIRSTDAQAQDIGAQLTLGGLFNASSHYAFGGIAGRKENSTSGNVAGYLDFLTTTSAGALTSRMRIDSSGQVGIGVQPSAWAASRKSIEFGGTYGALSGNLALELYSNAYFNGTNYIYRNSSVPAALTSFNGAASGGWAWNIAGNGTAGNAISFTQAMTLTAAGDLLVGTTVSPSGTKIGSIAKLGKVNVEGTNTVTVSTSVVALARAYDTGGLFFISGYNTSGGTQGWWLVAARGGTVTTIASDNATGLTVAFTAPGAVLSMNTTSGTLSVSCISMTNQSV